LIQSFLLIAKHRPDFVLGVGGYASGPFVLAAALLATDTAIWEPNAHPGMANRWLSFFVDQCFVVFEEAKKYLNNKKIQVFGMPVRAEIESAVKSGKNDNKFHLFSFGGSQGSRVISTALSDAILAKGVWTRDLQVVHQIGALDFTKLQAKYQGYEDTVTALEFIYDMPKFYSWADLVVCRGGASTIAELAAYGVVPIIIPLPAADGHQQKNAESLVNAGAGAMILQKDLSVQKLIDEIQKLRNDASLRSKMAENIKKFYVPKAANKIAQEILNSIGNK
jgi:UDP-N-acetylglucosamine--N-acetylmuramyl-(pentapeptide) pyrophosphoryl-undecaprenol N-acetylglucosamine transferase